MDWKEFCKGCGNCCGPLPFDYGFYLAHKSEITVKHELIKWDRGIVVPTSKEDTTCVFFNKQTGLCKIYDDRPQVCKDYGNIDRLKCPKKENTLAALRKVKDAGITTEEIKDAINITKKGD